jgi:hypothetical protein
MAAGCWRRRFPSPRCPTRCRDRRRCARTAAEGHGTARPKACVFTAIVPGRGEAPGRSNSLCARRARRRCRRVGGDVESQCARLRRRGQNLPPRPEHPFLAGVRAEGGERQAGWAPNQRSCSACTIARRRFPPTAGDRSFTGSAPRATPPEPPTNSGHVAGSRCTGRRAACSGKESRRAGRALLG